MDYASASQSQPEPLKITQSQPEPTRATQNHPEPVRASQSQPVANKNIYFKLLFSIRTYSFL